MIDATVDFAQREGVSKDAFEFQMLYGIRRDLQEQLARDGYGMRVYVPTQTLVSLFYAATGRTAGKHLVRFEELWK